MSLLPHRFGMLRDKLSGRSIPGHSGQNALWSALDAASGPVAALLMSAGLVRALGKSDYGVIVVALAVSNLSAAINPAISATTIKFVAEAVTDRKKSDLGKIISSSVLAVLLIDVLLLLAAALFKAKLAQEVFGDKFSEVRMNLGSVLLLAVSAVCLQQLDGVFAAALKGLERFRLQFLVEMLSRTSQVILSVAAGWASRDVRVVLVTYCLVCAASAGLRLTVLRLAMGDGRLLEWPAKPDVSRLLRFGGWMWLNAAATMAFGTVDRIVVGRVSGPGAAAEYSIYMQLAQLIHFIPSSLMAFTFPLFSRLGADRRVNLPAIKSLYDRYFRLASIIGLFLGVGLLFFSHSVLSLFGSSVMRERHDAAFAILIASFVTLSLNVIPYYLGLGLGNARAVSLITSISMFASIVLTISLTPAYGMMGAAIARLTYGLGALALIYMAHGLIQRK